MSYLMLYYIILLGDAFDELRAFCDAFDLEAMDSMEHAHVPYVVILVKALDIWRSQVQQLLQLP